MRKGRDLEFLRERFSQELRLIVASFPVTGWMEGYGNDQIELTDVDAVRFNERKNEPGEMVAQDGFISVFIEVNEFFHGLIIEGGSPGAIEVRLPVRAVRTKGLGGNVEMTGTSRTKWRTVFPDSILAACTQINKSFPVGKMPGAKNAIGGEEKIVEAVEKGVEHRCHIIMSRVLVSIQGISEPFSSIRDRLILSNA